jgi:hypothetical protein
VQAVLTVHALIADVRSSRLRRRTELTTRPLGSPKSFVRLSSQTLAAVHLPCDPGVLPPQPVKLLNNRAYSTAGVQLAASVEGCRD